MRVVFLGATRFSEAMLRHLMENRFHVEAVFTIPETFHISYSEQPVRNYNYADLRGFAKKHGLRTYEVDSGPGKRIGDYYEVLAGIGADVILVVGWYYMVPKRVRDLAKYGAWGIHASLLPKYGGGAPLVWAMIRGEEEAGVTLFRLGEGVDDGEIIAQEKFPIAFDDTIREVYEKAVERSKGILVHALNNSDTIDYRPQDKKGVEHYPQRRPEDGELDLSKSAMELYNFIRAQSSPYPGAFIRTADGKRLVIERVRIEDD
jgi:methionyl-tRNA formyltransferase